MEKFVRKHITLRREHAEWVKKNCINLSRFVQKRIEEAMRGAAGGTGDGKA